MSKPREFYISKYAKAYECPVIVKLVESDIHVIEKSAADKLADALFSYHCKELSHYEDCKNSSDENEDDDILFCDCGMADTWLKAQNALREYRGEA